MNRSELLSELAEILEVEGLSEDQNLSDIDSWDSMGMIAYISLVDDECNKELDPDLFEDCQTIGDLMNLALE